MKRGIVFYRTAFLIVNVLLCIFIFKLYSWKITNNIWITNTNITKDSSFLYSAVIVEFRPIPLLITVILNVIQNIPEHWPIQLFYSQSNKEFIQKSGLVKYIQNRKIILTELVEYHGNFRTYTNSLLTNISFWEQVRGETVLFFQVDSIMCSNSPHKITDYLQYDYIGAPWASRQPSVGNGGFSLRSKKKIITLLKQTYNTTSKYNDDVNEDVWYSIHMSTVGSIPPLNVAKTFSVESIFYENPLAVHKMEISGVKLKKLCDMCPEARLVPPHCR